MSIKHLHHVCIQTDCYEKSLNFYTNILGFQIISETPNFHNRYFNTWLKLGDFMIELQTNKKDETLNKWSSKNSGIVHMCFFVDNVEAEFNRIKALGHTNFKLKNGKDAVYYVEGSALCKIKAPEGTEIELRDCEL